MANYQEATVTLTNKQLKSAAKYKTRTILRLDKKKFDDEKLPHELFLITRQTKIRNLFTNNMPTDIQLNNAQISKIFWYVDLLVLD